MIVCDDNRSFRELLVLLLALEDGLTVVGEAADGCEAVDVARELQPDVVVLDVAMPKLDGIQALPLIREASPDSEVVIVTAFGSDRIRSHALQAGACRYVEKGLDISAIVAEIKGVCAA